MSAPAFVVYAAATLATCTMTVTRPAQAVITPEVARTPGELTAVNLVTGWAESTAIFLAPALAGVLLGLSGPAAVYGVFAALIVGGGDADRRAAHDECGLHPRRGLTTRPPCPDRGDGRSSRCCATNLRRASS